MNIREVAELRAQMEGKDNARQHYSNLTTTLKDETRRGINFPNAVLENGRWVISEAEGLAWATKRPLWLNIAEAAKLRGISRQRLHVILQDETKFSAWFPNRRRVGDVWLLWRGDVENWIEGK